METLFGTPTKAAEPLTSWSSSAAAGRTPSTPTAAPPQTPPVGGGSAGKEKRDSPTSVEDFDRDVDPEPHITWFAAFTTYLGYAVLIFLGRARDLVGPWVGEVQAPQRGPKGMAPLIFPSENFYTRRLYDRVQEAFNRPIFGAPGARINVVTRERRPGDMLMHVKHVKREKKEGGAGRRGRRGTATGRQTPRQRKTTTRSQSWRRRRA